MTQTLDPHSLSHAHIVDDEQEDRNALRRCVEARGWTYQEFAAPTAFVRALPNLRPGFVFLDVRMPEMSGLDVVDILRESEPSWPIIMVSGGSDIPIAVKALQNGAHDFVQKPFSDTDLADAIDRALNFKKNKAIDPKSRERLLNQITPRETDVIRLIAKGQPNKSIAFVLGISEKTVEVHRARALKRLGLRNSAELIKVAVQAGLADEA